MSYGALNIWLRYADCSLITKCWRVDLVIKLCGGQYLIDMESTPSVVDKLKAKYPDYRISAGEKPYCGERRITMILASTPATPEHHINHIEVDVPPGCYVVWARICHQGNEETNKVMAIVDCGTEVCVNLILNTLDVCSREIIHPILEKAAELKLPRDNIAGAARVILDAANMKPEEFNEELQQRADEAREAKDMELHRKIDQVKEILGGGD